MKTTPGMTIPWTAVLAVALAGSATAFAVKVGDTAPNFSAKDTGGQMQSLDRYHGKYVVLEWTNRDCPYTKKQYTSGNMQHLQKEWGAKGVVWITVLSSAKGQEGYMTTDEENAWVKKVGADPHAVILDTEGQLGHEYDAKTTPDMYVIDPSGRLIYSGAIDSKPTTDVSDVKNADDYVSDALRESMAGKQVAKDYVQPYGCSVKYGE